jgi:hypothetical protein
MTVSNRLKRFKQFKPQSAKNTMGTVLKEKRGFPHPALTATGLLSQK